MKMLSNLLFFDGSSIIEHTRPHFGECLVADFQILFDLPVDNVIEEFAHKVAAHEIGQEIEALVAFELGEQVRQMV